MKKAIFLLIAILFLGCSEKSSIGVASTSEQKLIFIKTPKLRYKDLGFIKEHQNGVSIEIYSAGVAIARIEIDDKRACINSDCYSKEQFVKEFLHKDYEPDIFEKILLGKKIDTKGAFYFVRDKEIYFDDELRGIKIVIKDIL